MAIAVMERSAREATRNVASVLPASSRSLMALLAAAFVLRLPHLGDPAFHVDEEFYLLVGDRMLHGVLPYVDIWDRKPIGLFLIFAAIRLLGGEGIVQYQLVATLFAGATAWVISRIARQAAGAPAALVAGIAYLVWIETIDGGGGQSPIFYNLLIAIAAFCTLRVAGGGSPATERSLGLAAMGLTGLAIQIKYTAAFEGMFFGLVLAARCCRTQMLRGAMLHIGALVTMAVLPTLAAALCYLSIDQGEAFWFANFASILHRGTSVDPQLSHRLVEQAMHVTILGGCFAASWFQLRDADGDDKVWRCFMLGWLIAAVFGACAVGAFYYHYLLPLFVPLSAGAAPIFRRVPIGPVLASIALWIPFANLDYPDFRMTAFSRGEIARLVKAMPADVGRRCLLDFEGPPILFKLTSACTLSRYVFPDHLSSLVEARAIGVDPERELRRILALAPAAITIGDRSVSTRNPRATAIVRDELAHHYRRAAQARVDDRIIDLYVRRPGV